MIRHAFTMKLKKGCEAEYRRRHDAIWPELAAELRTAGIVDYSIFLDEESSTLFAVQNLTDDHSVATLPAKPILRKWWSYMADIMETETDLSPRCTPLQEVFHL